MPDELAAQLSSVGALAEPVRRDLYRYVASQPDPVSRDQASAALGLPLHTVKFHLDRLVDEGLLTTEFRRLSGRTGPGAGRPSKLYRRSDRQVSISLPERRYDLAGDLLAAAIDRATRESVPVTVAVSDVAREAGRSVAATIDADAGTGTDVSADEKAETADAPALADMRRTCHVLAGQGYEPRIVTTEICLANCPFDRLAAEHTALVCGMNLAYIEGVLDGLGIDRLTARLAPQEGLCCVKVIA